MKRNTVNKIKEKPQTEENNLQDITQQKPISLKHKQCQQINRTYNQQKNRQNTLLDKSYRKEILNGS